MTRVLHVVRRRDLAAPEPLAYDVLEATTDGEPSRVLELFEPMGTADPVDLALGSRDRPELIAALHWAEQIHLHHVNPEGAFATLPLVRRDVLEDTLLVVHGPWPEIHRAALSGTARLTSWPGPCSIVGVELELPVAWAPRARLEAERFAFIDRQAPWLLPRSCGPVPLVLDDGRHLGVVALDAALHPDVRTQLKHGIRGLARAEVAVDVCDEHELALNERANARRACQAFVTLCDQGMSRTLLEACVQRLPIVALGDRRAPVPDVVWCRGAALEAVDRVVSCVRGWAQAWAEGRPVAVDYAARERWLGECRGVSGETGGIG